MSSNYELKLDEAAQSQCKALGCRIVRCMANAGKQDCTPLRRQYAECITKKKEELRKLDPQLLYKRLRP